jgi:hypothetical protein
MSEAQRRTFGGNGSFFMFPPNLFFKLILFFLYLSLNMSQRIPLVPQKGEDFVPFFHKRLS